MTEAAYLLLGTALTVASTVALTVWRSRRASPETQATLVGASDLLLSQLQSRVAALETSLIAVEAELDRERKRADEFETLARRLRSMPDHLEPMEQFVENGWLMALNDIAAEHGVQVSIYLDDIDGRIALGHEVAPLDTTLAHRRPPAGARRKRRQRMIQAAADARVASGLDPITPE